MTEYVRGLLWYCFSCRCSTKAINYHMLNVFKVDGIHGWVEEIANVIVMKISLTEAST